MYVVGVGLKKVYKVLIKLAGVGVGVFCIPLLMSMSEAFLSIFRLS